MKDVSENSPLYLSGKPFRLPLYQREMGKQRLQRERKITRQKQKKICGNPLHPRLSAVHPPRAKYELNKSHDQSGLHRLGGIGDP